VPDDFAQKVSIELHRDVAVLSNVAHKLARSTGNDQINLILKRKHFLDICARVEQVDRVGRNLKEMGERVAPNRDQRLIAVLSFCSTFKNYGIAGLKCQRGNLRNDFGSCLKHNADDTNRARFFIQRQSVIQLSDRKQATQRVGQGRHLADAPGHLRDLALAHSQTFINRPRHSPRFQGAKGIFAVALISDKDL